MVHICGCLCIDMLMQPPPDFRTRRRCEARYDERDESFSIRKGTPTYSYYSWLGLEAMTELCIRSNSKVTSLDLIESEQKNAPVVMFLRVCEGFELLVCGLEGGLGAGVSNILSYEKISTIPL